MWPGPAGRAGERRINVIGDGRVLFSGARCLQAGTSLLLSDPARGIHVRGKALPCLASGATKLRALMCQVARMERGLQGSILSAGQGCVSRPPEVYSPRVCGTDRSQESTGTLGCAVGSWAG